MSGYARQAQRRKYKSPLLLQGGFVFTGGWDSWIRTNGMTESKSVALPLGYIPVVVGFIVISC